MLSQKSDTLSQSKGFTPVLVLLIVVLAGAGLFGAYYLGIQKESLSDDSLRYETPTPQVPTSTFTEEVVQIKVRQPYYDDLDVFYEFRFSKQPEDIVTKKANRYLQGYFDGIEIQRGEAALTIEPVFEGSSVPYYDQKPEIVELSLTKVTSRPVWRVRGEDSTYVYVTDYSTDCGQWQPLPLACHFSNVTSDEKEKHTDFAINLSMRCAATTSTVAYCDEIVKDVKVKAINP